MWMMFEAECLGDTEILVTAFFLQMNIFYVFKFCVFASNMKPNNMELHN